VNAVDLLRDQFLRAHAYLEATLDDLPRDAIHYCPPQSALPIGAHFGHVVIAEDGLTSLFITGSPPLYASSWSGKTGFSDLPPEGEPWDEWARNLQVDLAAAREYARAVYAHTDQILSRLSDDDLWKPLDLTPAGLGTQTVAFLFSTLIGDICLHCGEISCIKGLQGLKGYPQ
jgi:hypothetical protein